MNRALTWLLNAAIDPYIARRWRIEFAGALYQVLSRGNGGQVILLSDNDRQIFLDLLRQLVERFNVQLHAYVLMGSHYHHLLKTQEANLSRAMQWFGTTYTRKFNLKNSAGGHLFQGRFKSIIIENDAYLLRLSCYIHWNPLRVCIVKRLADYQWSSHRFYAYRKELHPIKKKIGICSFTCYGRLSGCPIRNSVGC